MRILHVIPSVSLAHGGPSRAIGQMERALSALGVRIEVATTDDDGPGKRVTDTPTLDVYTDNTPVRHYFAKRLEFYKVSPAFAQWIFSTVGDYDLVHIHALFSFTSVAAAWAARRSGIPYVVRPLGTLNQYGVRQRRPWLKRLSLKLVEGPILRHAAAVHFTAETEREEAESLGIPMRSAVVPLGVATAQQQGASLFLQRYPELADRKIVLFLSRLDPKKNVEGLLQAFSLTSECLPETSLVIAGDGDAAYVAGLKLLAQELGLADRVVWAGFVDGDLKASAFASAQLFALPSFSENFGIAAAEALQAGLPCVLGKGVAIAGEVAEAGAGFAVAPDAGSIAEGLSTVLLDQPLRDSMAERAIDLARSRYSIEAMGAGLHALYSKILSQEFTDNQQ